jgi:hypothetical protein
MAEDSSSTNRDARIEAEESKPTIAKSVPAQESAEVRPKESPPPDEPAGALESDTEKTPAVNASTSKAETTSTPNTEATPTASNRLLVNVGLVDPTIAYVLAQQLSRWRRPIGRAFPPEPVSGPPGSLARGPGESPSPNTPADRQLYAEDRAEPAARAKESTPEPASPVKPEPVPPTEPLHVEPTLVSSAPEVESNTLPPTTPPDESTSDQVESDTPNNSARRPRPGDTKVKDFVGAYIENAKANKRVPTKQGLWNVARNDLPGATRKRLYDEYEKQTPTLSPGRPRNNRK